MKVLTGEAMAAVDRRAIEELGVPSLVLMENAALGVVEALFDACPEVGSVGVFCGPGNNGGDGLAVARHLAARGVAATTFVLAGGRGLSADTAAQLAILRRLGVPVAEVAADEPLGELAAAAGEADVVIDALYGTGLARPLEGQAAALVEALNGVGSLRLAVDLPSGLLASRASIPGPHLRADCTVALAALKVAHVLWPAAAACGRVALADLGVPYHLVAEAVGDLYLEVPEALAAALPPRPPASHKGDFGHVLVVAGSVGKGGAAALAALGAVRGGAGLVTVATPGSLLSAVAAASLEAMTLPLPEGPTGELALAAVEPVLAAAEARDALAIGPGLGESEEAREVARRIVLETRCPAVVDADALNAFAGRARELRGRRAPTVLTPHPGELGRLLGTSAGEISEDRLGALAKAVGVTGAHVVLKGHQTLTGAPEGRVTINTTGNPGMASGGMGDALTGIIGAFLGQALRPETACRLAVYLHGLAGDLAAARGDEVSLSASDLLEALPEACRRLRSA